MVDVMLEVEVPRLKVRVLGCTSLQHLQTTIRTTYNIDLTHYDLWERLRSDDLTVLKFPLTHDSVQVIARFQSSFSLACLHCGQLQAASSVPPLTRKSVQQE